MKLITVIALAGILLLQVTHAIPQSSVGGPMVVAAAFLAAALAVAAHEAWTERRGPLGWVLNGAIALVAMFFAAQAGGMAMVVLLAPFTDQSSLAASGSGVMATALAGAMAITLLGVRGALLLARRWR